MDHEIILIHEHKVLLCIIKENINVSMATAISRQVRKQAYELDYGILYDVTNVNVGASIADAYSFARDIKNIYQEQIHRLGKAAFLYKSDKGFWEFYETTASNAGAKIKSFTDKDKALEWLMGK